MKEYVPVAKDCEHCLKKRGSFGCCSTVSNNWVYACTEGATASDKEQGTAGIQAIYTEALEEGIRCAMCTNTMKSERGCDGGCVVDEKMYKKVLTEINSRLLRQSPQTEQENPMAGIDLDNATNGDVMMAIFKEIQYYSDGHIDAYWWNEPYKKYKKENVK